MDEAEKKGEKKDEQKRSYVTQALGKSISRLTRSTYGKRGFADGEILQRWPLIVGEMLAATSHPEKIVYPTNKNGNGTLHLRVGNAGMALDIQHMEPLILDRINAHFGYRAVARLKLIQAPLPASRTKQAFQPRPLSAAETRGLNQTLGGVDDPDLKQVLLNLGQSVASRNKR
ncbi:MAG: DUF721 domain-containing protein [Rhodospirillales bacterium]|nr:DUF721 domain-containing protein [Rhodospirillales bacterium]